MGKTSILYLNHSSILVKYEQEYLLCDPWFEKPAFGSWLPTFPLFVHPVYIASLTDKLRILISHGHDDHCDDDFLHLFDRNTPIISSDFASPSVQKRIERIGFENFIAANNEGVQAGCFHIQSFRSDDISEDDATYLISTPDALIVHCNDNWFTLQPWQQELIKAQIEKVGVGNTIYMSQTNSASGFPLNYTNYSKEQKAEILKTKVDKMISTGMNNAHSLGIKNFHSYAGYASIFVKDKPDYLTEALFPTPRYIKEHLSHLTPNGLEVLDFYPGDIFDFNAIQKSFFASDIDDTDLKLKSSTFYTAYGQVDTCDSYNEEAGERDDINKTTRQLQFFLEKLNEFVLAKTNKNGFQKSILGKKLTIEIAETLVMTLEFGKGIVDSETFNKRVLASPEIMHKVLDGKILFENLYTGYNAEFERNPVDEYNRDIIQYLVMYSYVYKNRLASTFN